MCSLPQSFHQFEYNYLICLTNNLKSHTKFNGCGNEHKLVRIELTLLLIVIIGKVTIVCIFEQKHLPMSGLWSILVFIIYTETKCRKLSAKNIVKESGKINYFFSYFNYFLIKITILLQLR